METGGRDHGEIGGEEEGISTEQVKGNKGGNEDDLRFGIALGSLKDVVQPDGHVNFFQDVEAGKRGPSGVNEEHEEEKKREQEEYEKKIGYLVYLGQDSVERSKDKPWWSKKVTGGGGGSKEELEREVERQRELDRAAGVVGGLEEKMVKVAGRKKGEEREGEEEVTVEQVKMTKFKSYLDPLKDIRKYLSMPGMKEAGGKGEKVGSSSKRKSNTPPPSSPPRKRRKGEEEEEKGKRKKKSKKSKKKHKHRNHSSERRRRKRSRGDSSGEGDEEEEEKRRKLKRMREERLEREREERRRAQKVLAKLRGEEEGEVGSGGKGGGDKGGGDPSGIQGGSSTSSSSTMASVKQKYNSQFNPHLARQNYE